MTEQDFLALGHRQRLEYLLKGDVAAIQFGEVVVDVLHVWDDLIDKDKDVGDEMIHAAFWGALVVLPNNPFYQRHFPRLNPLLQQAIINWHAANQMEREEGPGDLEIAFILRSAYADLISHAALIVGGPSWARHVTAMMRRQWHSERLGGYQANLEIEKRERAARHPTA